MKHKIGLHWLRHHPDRHDFAHVERMQYRSVKPFEWMWSDRDFCANLLAAMPGDSYILARDHPLSEQKEDLWRDPVGTGVRHANEWAFKVASGNYHLPVERTFFLGVNEPDATNGDRAAIDRYNVSFLDRLAVHGLRGGAFNFSTGHPRTVDGTPDTPADYTVFEASHQAIVRGHHIAVAHIYGTAAVPLAPGNYDRLTACNWTDVEWVIGEFGIDEHVIGGGPHVGFHGELNGRLHEYCGWIDQAIMGIEAIFPYIHDYELYTYDFSHPWGSFNTQVIREFLESYNWQHAKQGQVSKPKEQHTINLPSIKAGDTRPVAIVNVPAGANVRTGPGANYPVRGAEPQGTVMEIIGKNAAGDWWLVDMPHAQGWVSTTVVSVQNVGNVPVRVSIEDETDYTTNWDRSWPIVLKIEGGLSLDPNDSGNYYQGKLVGTKYGISAAVWGGQYDIPNLTREQALAIYRKHYWEAAGCDQLPWPMCLIHFDTAVQHGVGVANQILNALPTREQVYLGLRSLRYMDDPKWRLYGEAWGVRVDHLQDIAKDSN